MNGLTFTFLEEGQLMVIEIEENIGVGFYKGTDTFSELFKTIQDFMMVTFIKRKLKRWTSKIPLFNKREHF